MYIIIIFTVTALIMYLTINVLSITVISQLWNIIITIILCHVKYNSFPMCT